ncbi:MAG: right-handed parallel beta-helix repeat-containing protein [Planctomycetes bacterium]|nr:right-handed parallel beta-helix repeat-containing protein [Planctomycetota bacterium]
MSIRERLVAIAVGASIVVLVAPCCAQQAAVNSQAIEDVKAGRRTEARASWWGFHPEDSTRALQDAIHSGANKLIVENMGKPWFVDKIQLASDQEVFFEQGAVVQAKRGAFKGKADALFTAALRKNVTLTGYGATLKMWKQDYTTPEYEKAEWRHVLSIRSSSNVKVHGLTLADSGGDGIYLGVAQRGVTNKDVHIKDVICVNNHRQGISVISAENLLIENTVMKDTGGTAPMAGIDFEPNLTDEKLVNCVMRNCVSENNQGDAYDFYVPTLSAESAPMTIRLENCQSRGCRRAVALTTGNSPDRAVKGLVEFVNCKFEGSQGAGILINQKPADGCKLRFVNCEVANAAASQPTQSPIMISSGSGNMENVGGIEFVDCVVKDALDRKPLSYMDFSGGLKLVGVTGTLIQERDGERTVHQLDQKLIDAWFPHQALRDIKRFNTKGVRYQPLFREAKPDALRPCPARQRDRAEFLLWAEAGQQVAFTVRILPVGRSAPHPTPVRVIAPSGKATSLPKATGEQETPYSFAAEETGAYHIVCEPASSTAQVSSATQRVCLYAENAMIHFLSATGDYHFYVPPGVSEFGVKVSGGNEAERVKAALFNPGGQKLDEKDNIAQTHQFLVTRPDATRGEVWRLRLDKPSQAVLEDFFVQLQGIPPVLSWTQEALLRPVEK